MVGAAPLGVVVDVGVWGVESWLRFHDFWDGRLHDGSEEGQFGAVVANGHDVDVGVALGVVRGAAAPVRCPRSCR